MAQLKNTNWVNLGTEMTCDTPNVFLLFEKYAKNKPSENGHDSPKIASCRKMTQRLNKHH